MVKITRNMDITPKSEPIKQVSEQTSRKFSWSRLCITLVIVILTAGVIGGSVWYLMDQANNINKKTIDDLQSQLNKITDEQKKTNEETAEEDATDEIVYKNTDYGFEITFPEGWEKYKVNKKSPSAEEDGSVLAYYYVGLPTSDKSWEEPGMNSGYWSLFALSIYTKDQWNTMSDQEGPKPSLVAQKGNYVIGWMSAQAGPTDAASQASAVQSIIDTIKFTN